MRRNRRCDRYARSGLRRYQRGAGKVSRSFDGVLDRGGTDFGECLSQRGVIPVLEKYGLDGLREDQRGSVEITQGPHSRRHTGLGGVLHGLVDQLVEKLQCLVDGDPFKRPEQRRQRGRPARFRQTCQGGRSHLAGSVCETIDHRVGRARGALWREVRRADRINPFQMRHELAGSEASRRTPQLFDQRRAAPLSKRRAMYADCSVSNAPAIRRQR